MTKEIYMSTLAKKLRRLPKEDYDKAIAYFEEYFEEAGPENEAQAIEDLGTPESAASNLILDLASKTVEERPKTVKRGLSAVWIGILGVCAAPIALPMLFAILLVVLSLLFVVLVLIFALIFSAVVLVVCGVAGIFGGIFILFSNFANGIATIGYGACSTGVGLACTYGSVLLCRWFLRKASGLLGKITKGGKQRSC